MRGGEAGGQTGEIWMRQKVCTNPDTSVVAGGFARALKGDGLFANCGHFCTEHGRFNDYSNV